jgi:DNA-directed RNA polymerase specialized sigma subunit
MTDEELKEIRVENRQKIKWLRRYIPHEKRIQFLCDEKAKWESIAQKITSTISDMPKANSNDNKIESAIEKITEFESQIDEEIDSSLDIKIEILAAIKTVSDPVLQNLLMMRYISDKKWEEIAAEMNYDYRWVLRLHGKALSMLNTPLKATS